MNLHLSNGYPFPFPEGLTPQQEDEINDKAGGLNLTITGVIHYEMKHTITIEFATRAHLELAMQQTGWPLWCDADTGKNILEARYSHGEGYDITPALIVNNIAYCGFSLLGAL